MNGQAQRSGRGSDPLSRSAAGGRNPWLVAVVISIATFMQVLDTSIANVALQYIAGSLAASVDESTWILTSYLVASAVILPISGRLSGVVGRKRFYMACVATFTVSSVLCALAPNLTMLILFRVLQGIGGGGMAPSEQAMLADTFPENKRPLAFALYGVAVLVAPTVGPTLGGWLTDNLSWHWIFLINGPIGAISLVLVSRLVTEPEVLERERKERIARGLEVDWIGFILVALFLGCLEIVLDKGQEDDWFSSNFILFFATVSFVSFVLFVPWELTRKEPIVDLKLYGHAAFASSSLMMLTVGAILFGTTQLIPQLLQGVYQYSATLSGLALMPGGVAMLMLMPVVGVLAAHMPAKYLIAGGMASVALSMFYMTSLSGQADFSFYAWARVLQTVGLPFVFIPITSASYTGLPPQKTSEASSLINVARNLGGSIGISAATTIIARSSQVHQNYLAGHLVPSSPAYQQAIANAAAALTAQGVPPAVAPTAAFDYISQVVMRQATLLAYIDVFMDFALLALLMAPVALILLRSGSPRPAH
jgi:MFS transporter, DHA2 family, multidrug resistance protein